MILTHYSEDEEYEYAYLPDIDSKGIMLLKMSIRRKSDGRHKVTWILPKENKKEVFRKMKEEL